MAAMAVPSSLTQRIETFLEHRPVLRAGVVLLFLLLLLILFASLIHITLHNNTIGMDYYTFWLAGQRVLQGQNPYDEQVAIQSQLGIMRRLAGPEDDQMGFAYPPYALLPTLPFALLPFDWAQAFWLAFCFLSLVSALYAIQPSRAVPFMAIVLLFFPVTFGLLLGNFVILISAILLVFFALVVFGNQHSPTTQILMGALLAWTTIKPQFIVLYLLFIAFYAVQKQFQLLILSFLITSIGFLMLSFILVPGWPSLWFDRINRYASYMHTLPMLLFLLRSILPQTAATIAAIVIALPCMLIALQLAQRWRHNLLPLPLLLAWIGLCAYLLHPRNVAYAQIAFLLPFFLWLLNQPTWRPQPIPHLLLIGILGSWIIFGLAKWLPAPNLADELRLALYALWCLWLFRKTFPKQELSHAT
jgi:hypothetical protein